MQLFIVSKCPVACARYLDDRRCNKIILESAQMICTAIRTHKLLLTEAEDKRLYKSFNPKHPCCRWVAATRANYMWAVNYHRALLDEWYLRRGCKHAAWHRFDHGNRFEARAFCIPEGPLQPPANAARSVLNGLDFTNVRPTTRAYREYLDAKWAQDIERGYHVRASILFTDK